MKLIYILSLMILSINFAASQNLSPREKIKREIQILDNFENKDWNEKSTIFREITELWFDTVKYKVEIEESAKNNKANYAAIISERDNEDNQKLAFFDSKTGKIVKLIHLDQINPYTKDKDKKIDNTDGLPINRYSYSEKKDGERPIKFKSGNRGFWRENNENVVADFFITSFNKYGLNKYSDIIDEWETFVVFDTLGNVIMNHEFNNHSIRFSLNSDATYFLAEFAIEGWERNGFCVYDIKAKKEVYCYSDPKNEKYGDVQGVVFNSDNDKNYIVASLSVPKDRKLVYEKLIIDLSQSMEYRRVFTIDERNKIKKRTIKNYLEYLLSNFDFDVKKF